MLLRTQGFLGTSLAGLVVCLAPAEVYGQVEFQPPQNSLALDDKGTLEAMQGNLVKFRDSNNDVWYLQVDARTTVSIVGEADFEYLRPGLTVELNGKINAEGTLDEPVKELTALNTKGRSPTGLFPPDDASPEARPIRNPKPGEYRIRGKVVSAKDGDLVIAAGRLKIAAKAADDLKVKLALDDPSLAQFGDEMKIKAWYYDLGKPNATLNRPGKALAEELTITLSKPPANGKRR